MTGPGARGRAARLACGVLVAAASVAWARRRWTVVVVRGSSMAPTLRDGDRLLVRRRSAPPDRGDVVVFRHPGSRAVPADPALRVKRVAAVAGDPMPAWVSEGAAVDHRLRTVPDGQLVVHGDARLSQDSRQVGLVPVSALVGILPDPRPPRRGVAPRPTPPDRPCPLTPRQPAVHSRAAAIDGAASASPPAPGRPPVLGAPPPDGDLHRPPGTGRLQTGERTFAPLRHLSTRRDLVTTCGAPSEDARHALSSPAHRHSRCPLPGSDGGTSCGVRSPGG